MPPVASTTSPAFSRLQFGLNRKLEYRLCMKRSSSRACAILLASLQLLSIPVSFSFSHAAHCSSICFSCTSCTHAPERQMQTHSRHDNTSLPGSSSTPIVVKKCCRLRAFISHCRADSGRLYVLYFLYGRSRLYASATSQGMRPRSLSACSVRAATIASMEGRSPESASGIQAAAVHIILFPCLVVLLTFDWPLLIVRTVDLAFLGSITTFLGSSLRKCSAHRRSAGISVTTQRS